MINITLTTKPNPWYSPLKSTSKKGVAGLGLPKQLAAQSRNTAQTCGFFVRAPVLAARMGSRKARRLMASASCPVVQPVRAASLVGLGVAVVQRSNWRPHMAHKTTTPTPGNLSTGQAPNITHSLEFARAHAVLKRTPDHRKKKCRDLLMEQATLEARLRTVRSMLDALTNTTAPAQTMLGKVLQFRVKPRPAPVEPVARQQAIENHLSAALHLVRTTNTTEGYSKAVGRAIRAASMLKQACTEANNGGRA